MLGLACNETIVDVSLDISCNNLGSQGAHVLESCIHGVRSIAALDITENSENLHENKSVVIKSGKLVSNGIFLSDMDVELASVITAVSKNKSIKHLHMGRNLVNMKAKHVSTIMEALVQMIQVRKLIDVKHLRIQGLKQIKSLG